MFRRRGYRVIRRLIRWMARPRIAGNTPGRMAAQTVFVLPRRSLLDLAVLDLVCARHGLARSPVEHPPGREPRRPPRGFPGAPRRSAAAQYDARRASAPDATAGQSGGAGERPRAAARSGVLGPLHQPRAIVNRQAVLRALGGNLAPAPIGQHTHFPQAHRCRFRPAAGLAGSGAGRSPPTSAARGAHPTGAAPPAKGSSAGPELFATAVPCSARWWKAPQCAMRSNSGFGQRAMGELTTRFGASCMPKPAKRR